MQALTERYQGRRLEQLAAVTLESDVAHEGREGSEHSTSYDFPPALQWMVRSMSSIVADIDTMLDTEVCPMSSVTSWGAAFQDFASFLRDNPTGPDMKRRRTHLRFIADLGKELAEASFRAGITPHQMSDWLMNYSEDGIREVPALGLFREVMHEKLSDNQLQWNENDLVDMMYLTSAAGYCTHVVAERTHASHIKNSARRLGRAVSLHRNLRSLVDQL